MSKSELTLDVLMEARRLIQEAIPILYYAVSEHIPPDDIYQWKYPPSYKVRHLDFFLLIHPSRLEEMYKELGNSYLLREMTPLDFAALADCEKKSNYVLRD